MDNKDVFATNLKRYMDENGKSRKEVSEAIGVSYYTFTDWAKGKKYPRMDKVEKLAEYFGILKSDLIEKKSVKDRIEESPAKAAELHFEILMDEDFVGMFDDFKRLDEKKRKIVKDLAHNLAETEI